MKTILRNFISVLRRFRMATLLNILGLSIAFAAFMVIMMQVIMIIRSIPASRNQKRSIGWICNIRENR